MGFLDPPKKKRCNLPLHELVDDDVIWEFLDPPKKKVQSTPPRGEIYRPFRNSPHHAPKRVQLCQLYLKRGEYNAHVVVLFLRLPYCPEHLECFLSKEAGCLGPKRR